MRAFHVLLLLSSLVGISAFAQHQNTQEPLPTEREQLSNNEQKNPQSGQRTERIALEDAGSRVSELRVGGQTQTISVQPKGTPLPAYEVQPTGARQRSHSDGEGNTTGARVWNVLKF